MFGVNLSSLNISDVLNNLDSAAKETLEETKVSSNSSATEIRNQRKKESNQLNSINNEINSNQDNHIYDNSTNESIINQDTSIIKTSNNIQTSEIIQLKNLEIERLNSECLELEDHVTSLKSEIQDAWSSYKTAQEKSAIREGELLDEIEIMKKAKQSDKLQYKSHITKLSSDLEECLQRVKSLEKEKVELVTLSEELQEMNNKLIFEKKNFENELAEARFGSGQGIQILREELNQALVANDTLRSEHAIFIRNIQYRQSELEQQNTYLATSIAHKQEEINNLEEMLRNHKQDEFVLEQIDTLQERISKLSDSLDEECTTNRQLEKQCKQLELEAKASSIAWSDERQHLEITINDLSSQLHSLQERLKENLLQSVTPLKLANSSEDSEVLNLKSQIQDLNKKLLKKQEQSSELQAERSALKSRILDYQKRCSSLEQQLSSIKDIEDDDFSNENQTSSFFQDSYSLRKRQTNQDESIVRNSTHISKNLEKLGVKVGTPVAKAVDYIDNWTLFIVRLIRAYPLVRLGFVIYLLVLHLWVLIILAMETHSLELETDPREAIIISKT